MKSGINGPKAPKQRKGKNRSISQNCETVILYILLLQNCQNRIQLLSFHKSNFYTWHLTIFLTQ